MNPFGNLLTTVFALAFGLVSFKTALETIFRGVAYTAGEATFPFATRPVGFLLIVIFWLVMGVCSFWLAWADISKNRLKGDGDDAEQALNTVPMEGHYSTDREALPRADTGSKFDQFVQRAKSSSRLPTHPSETQKISWEMPTDKASAPLPAPLLLYKSRPYAIFLLGAFTFFIVGVAFTCFFLIGLLGQKLSVCIFSFWFLAYLRIVYLCVVDWRWEGPALELSQYAITDHFHGDRCIPWTDIQGFRLTASSQNTLLVLQFADIDGVRRHFGNSNLLHAIWQRIFYNGFEGRIKLTSLTFKRAEIARVVQAFLRHSKR